MGNETRYGYDSLGSLTSVTNGLGHVTTYAYDPAGRPVVVTDPLGHKWSYGYDANGRPASATLPTGERSRYAYDPRGLLATVSYSDGTVEEFGYDAAGRLIRAASPDATYTMTHDPAGRRTAEHWVELEKTTRFEYDRAGQRTKLTTPEGRAFLCQYDEAGRPISFTDSDGHETLMTYDPLGHLTGVMYPNGVTETRSYNQAGQLTEILTPGPSGVIESYTYTYDERGFKTKQVEEDGAVTRWFYDGNGRIVRVEYPAEKIRAIRELGETSILRLRPGADAEEESEGGGNQGDAGRPESEQGPPPVVPTPGPPAGGDTPDRPSSPPGKGPGGAPSGNSLPTGESPPAGKGKPETTPGKSAVPPSVPGPAEGPTVSGEPLSTAFTPAYTLPVREWVEYQYDAAGNRVLETSDLGSVPYVYDPADRLLSTGDVSFSYDAAGRLVRREAPDQSLLYRYDVAGRLREVSSGDGTGVTYGYDAFGRKVTRTATFWSSMPWDLPGPAEQGLLHRHHPGQGGPGGIGGGPPLVPPGLAKPRLKTETTHYLWDDLRVLAEYTETGAPLSEYHIAADRILAQKVFGYHNRKEPGVSGLQTLGGLMYYSSDGLGNVSALTDRQGGLITRYRYDTFGGLLTSATAPYNLIGAFGKEYDPASNLIYFGARWYDAPVGRFTTPDPFPGVLQDPITLNPYLLAKANPVNYVDRWGLHVEDVFIVDLSNEVLGARGHVWNMRWLADRNEWFLNEVLRTPEKIIREHVWVHFHLYDVLHWLCEYIQDEHGDRYWTIIMEERYISDWVPVLVYVEVEEIDLIALKQDIAIRDAGWAPPSSVGRSAYDTGGGEWILSGGLGILPGVGEMKDLQEAITGVDLITGERLTGWERGLTAVLIFVPFVGGSTVRGALKGGEALAEAARRGARAGVNVVEGALGHGDDFIRVTEESLRGTTVYRLWPKHGNQWSRSWTTVDPRTYPDFAESAGLPRTNTGEMLSIGIVKDPTGITIRPSLPIGSRLGGLVEVVIPDAARQVRLLQAPLRLRP